MKMLQITLITLISVLVSCFASPLSTRIYGAEFAEPDQFPHQVALYINYYGTYYFKCAGSIINANFILTPAFCVADSYGNVVDPEEIIFNAGSNNLLNFGLTITVQKIISHENYDQEFKNNIALLLVSEPIVFYESVQPIAIFNGILPTSSEVIVSGWGITEDQNISVDLKYSTFITTTSDEEGIMLLSHEENNGICFGDAGDPAVYNGQLVGFGLFIGDDCGAASLDGYVNTTYFIDWIDENIAKYSP